MPWWMECRSANAMLQRAGDQFMLIEPLPLGVGRTSSFPTPHHSEELCLEPTRHLPYRPPWKRGADRA